MGSEGAAPLRGPRQRALLTALLVSANEVVPEAVLLEQLWGDEPPRSGSTALRVRISQLRKLVGDAIVTRPPGYLLATDPELIDARRFERLLGEGSRALADDPERAASLLREGLALWRGPALADAGPVPTAAREAARLEELRVVALEHALEAELALGRHAEVVAELDALVAEEPLRENLRRLLMLALYRSGRQARALRVYRQGRERLVDELGIEPGAALRELEAAILRHDPALDLPAPPTPVEEERKLVTVLVASPAQPGLAGEIEEAGGSIERADERMVVASFGALLAQEDHAARGLRTARRLAERYGVQAGVETGEVVVSWEGTAPRLAGGPLQAAMLLARASAGGAVPVRGRAATRRTFEFGRAAGGPGRPLVRELVLRHTRAVRRAAPRARAAAFRIPSGCGRRRLRVSSRSSATPASASRGSWRSSGTCWPRTTRRPCPGVAAASRTDAG